MESSIAKSSFYDHSFIIRFERKTGNMAGWDEYGGTLGDLHVNVDVSGMGLSSQGFVGGGGMDVLGGIIPILGGMTSLIFANLSDPTWRPSSPTPQMQQHVTPPECVMIANEIQNKKKRIQNMLLRRESYRVALEKLRGGRNWQYELDDIAEQSQSAQLHAIWSSIMLFFSAAGPMDAAIELWRERATANWESVLVIRDRLESIKGDLFEKGLPLNNGATQTLQHQYDVWTEAMKTKDSMVHQLENIQDTMDHIDKTLIWIEPLKDLKLKHRLLLGTKALPDTLVDFMKVAKILRDPVLEITKDHLMDKLSSLGAKTTARFLGLADFIVSYTYESARFYTSFKQLNDVMSYIDDINRLSNIFSEKILVITDQIKNLKGEVDDLEKIRAKDEKEGCKNALYDIARKELQEQYIAGEWFSQQTGVRAAGRPILDGNI